MKVNNVIFYNYYNNGDIFCSREFIKYIMKNIDANRFIYQNKNSSRLLLDIENLEHTTEITGDNRHGIYFVGNDVYINTWFNSLNRNENDEPYYNGIGSFNRGKYNNGTNLQSLYDYFSNELYLLDIRFDKELYDFIPTIDFSKCKISKIRDFMSHNKNKKVFLCNGDAKSNQSNNDIRMDDIIYNLSQRYKNILFIVSNPTNIKEDNVLHIKELIPYDLENDMYECAYASIYCDVIIGRFSGVSTCTCIKDNMYKNKKFIMIVHELQNWDMDLSLKNCGTQFIPCNYTTSEDVSNFIINEIETHLPLTLTIQTTQKTLHIQKIGDIIENIIKDTVIEILNKSKNVDLPPDIIETDNIGEVIEKLSILHCRMWYLEDAIGASNSDEEIANLKRKIDICFKQKRPKYVEAINRMIEKSIIDGKSLIEDSVKFYKGFQK